MNDDEPTAQRVPRHARLLQLLRSGATIEELTAKPPRDAGGVGCAELGRGVKGKRGRRRPTLASVAKQASKAGIEVARYEVEPDKIVVIVVGKSGMDNAATTNEWDQEFDGAASEIH